MSRLICHSANREAVAQNLSATGSCTQMLRICRRMTAIAPASVPIVSTILLCMGLCASARADNEGNGRQKFFEMDKAAALSSFNTAHKQDCIDAFNSRYQSQYVLKDALTLDEPLSLAAYDRLFWKGTGSLQRGLIFTASVNDRSGAKAGNLICYYAITDFHLDFQSAYLLPLQLKGMNMASSREGNI
jgi:hypothetical protein